MRQVGEFPYRVREIMTEWVPMADGCRLAARLWLPEGAGPVPAVLEYLPYRRRDGTAIADSIVYRYLAGHGFAGARVDIRGTGDSEGVILDEYDRPELDDARQVIAWLAARPWCSGEVGMWGFSWGGFNALQVAALRPPALRAIMTLYSTDDRYGGDCHYMGGCLLDENAEWGNAFFSNCSRPPDPEVVGPRWREMWLRRIAAMTMPIETWLRHQRRDAYWKHGSVCEDYGAIEAAVYAVGGWADGYTDAVPRLLANLHCPRKGLIGPWGHALPHDARPGPAIGFLQEAMRWWDHWLNGAENGIMDEPMLRVWMQESVAPAPDYDEWPGRWVAEPTWPPAEPRQRTHYLTAAGVAERPGPETPLATRSPQTVGMKAAKWCPYGDGPDMSDDQRSEDGQSICFDSNPLAERVEILGAPAVSLDLAVDRPRAFLAVRLNDVAPDGASTRVTYGVLNLAHRESHEHPEPLEPGRRIRVRVGLGHVAHAFPPGHRLRVAVSTAYWPMVWPSPEPVTLTLFAGSGELELPVRKPSPLDERLAPFGAAEGAAPIAYTRLRPRRAVRRFERDPEKRETLMRFERDRGAVRFHDIDLVYDLAGWVVNRIVDDDPLSAAIDSELTQRLSRPGWQVRSTIRSALTATRDDFLLTASLDAYEGEARVFSRNWSSRIPRDLL